MSLRSSVRYTRGLYLAVLGACVALLHGCDSPPSTIKIGVAQPLTGNLAPLGQDMLNGVTLAVEELNKQGFKVNGKPVTLEVVAVDDRADAKTGVEVAHQLVDAGVVAVIGDLNSGVSIAAAPVYAEKSIAQLAISTNPKFTQLGLNTTFRLVANDTLQAKAIGSFAASQIKGSKYALLDDGTPYGKGLAAGAGAQLKAAQKNIVLVQSFDDRTTAFDELAQKMKAGGVEVIVSTLNDFQVLALFEALKKVDHTDVTLLGGDTIKTTLMRKGVSAGQRVFATSPSLDVGEFPAGQAFLEKYRAKFKIDPAYAGHYSYDATYVLAAAMGRTPSAKPAAIVEALRKLDGYAPVTGSMKWDAKGEQRYGVIGVYRVREGAWESQVRSDVW
ncbi:MAG: branched-chain amino acid ABC transporter substrate-binding protein [Burkholderiales bacterium]|nr:branched-chain amino acid ABC transporter substrate-binding protein [Burkholderiales bacterium]